MRYRWNSGLSLWLVALVFLAHGCTTPAPSAVKHLTDITLSPEVEVIEARVPRNATLAGLLRAHELSQEIVTAVVEQAHNVFDLRRLRADHPYRLVRTFDGLLRRFEYHIDTDKFLRVVHTSDAPVLVEAEVVPYAKQRARVSLRGTIDADRPSLVAAVAGSGETVELAITLAEVFSGDIDFYNDLRRGDRFELLFERELRERRYAGYGDVLAAEFENDGRRLRAFRYAVPGKAPGYYDEQGRSQRRFFLRSPLRFEPRITSGFSYRRRHPVLGGYRPHLGVDYAAPRGTPVVSVASGTVVSAGRSGGSGLMVRLRHTNGYETYYLHLSATAQGVRRGAHVAQGQLIGRVGATGLATGPHLDYRLRQNGVFVNPLLVHRSLPPGEPIPEEFLSDFEAVRDQALAELAWPVPAGEVVAANAVSTSGLQASAAASQ